MAGWNFLEIQAAEDTGSVGTAATVDAWRIQDVDG